MREKASEECSPLIPEVQKVSHLIEQSPGCSTDEHLARCRSEHPTGYSKSTSGTLMSQPSWEQAEFDTGLLIGKI